MSFSCRLAVLARDHCRRLFWVAGAWLALVPAWSWAQVTLQSLSSALDKGVEVVRIEFSHPLARPPAGFSVQTPPRIALDLPGVSSGLSQGVVEVNQGNLRTVTVVDPSGLEPEPPLGLQDPD
jgi:type IV pilus assembly protein PilQ